MANGMKVWEGTLLCLKALTTLHQERRDQVNTIVMQYLNSILFRKSRPANRSIPINQSITYDLLLT